MTSLVIHTLVNVPESVAEGWTVNKHLTQGKIDMEVINELSDSLMCLPPMEL